MAAPMATASSGLTPLLGLFPKILETTSCTLGTLVIPPTRSTSSTSFVDIPASFKQFLQGSLVLSIRWCTRVSNFDLVSVIFKCFAPEASAVMNGRLISV
uniref:Heat shock 70 kDa protein n=1 Tax=Arundo donax TaxID=35708 RepID=A0A0A9AC65_ARUDO